MLEKQVQTATTSSMDTCRRQAMLMLGKPTVATVARIYIQNIEARNLPRRNANERARVSLPQLAHASGSRVASLNPRGVVGFLAIPQGKHGSP